MMRLLRCMPTSLAPEGEIAIAPYPKVNEWLHKIEALPGFIPMLKSR